MYRWSRKAVRALVTRHPWLDRMVGKPLARIDGFLHAWGILGSFDRRGEVEAHGLRFFFRPEDAPLARILHLNGDYEPATRKVVEDTLAPGSVFVDLGAHIGYFTMIAAREVSASGRIFSFEPIAGTRAVLHRNVEANGLAAVVTVVPFASSDKRETLRFVEAERSESSGIAVPGDRDRLVDIDAISLDEYFADLGWPRVDLVKMDVEGQELRTLKGMEELARRNPRMRIIFEFNAGQLKRCGVSAEDLFSHVRQMGYMNYFMLFREAVPFSLPSDWSRLRQAAESANVNILATR
jgi:FkbM family methyltransferase